MAILFAGLRLLVGGVFLGAAIGKLRNQRWFLGTLEDFQILPDGAKEPFSKVLPGAELLVGSLLVFGIKPLIIIPIAVALLMAFSVALAWVLIRGRRVECGCFGESSSARVAWHMVARNAVMVGLLIPAYIK